MVTHPDPGDRESHLRRTNTGASAVVESLRFLGAKNISVYAATSEDVTAYMVRYLTDTERRLR